MIPEGMEFENLEELQAFLDQQMRLQNSQSRFEFEGYSPLEMQTLLYQPFSSESPLQIKKAAPEDYQQVPVLQNVKVIINHIAASGELKLTQKGFLPVKLVEEVYHQGLMKDEMVEKGFNKVYKETDTIAVRLPRILLDFSGVVKKRNNKLSLTKNGEKVASDDYSLWKLLFESFCTRYNWGYFDGYDNQVVGALGFGFSLILLNKYGMEIRPADFYAEKYLNAFPSLIQQVPYSGYGDHIESIFSCYNIRTFKRGFDLFGLTTLTGESFRKNLQIVNTPNFSKMINIRQSQFLNN
mgnify:CR=1 FL=1